ncbi:uncharacterized protein QC763_0029940 [Podospora pseudopauciseta]|uniref:Uncharacterized protein n=1 Tax=Podospora pseudopauciseta TaxID=2093780 RepID=A0ABR0HN16_9PEZI|nr:hypothetical protein QC763_0029940 [Podospora pseudopauciseta]
MQHHEYQSARPQNAHGPSSVPWRSARKLQVTNGIKLKPVKPTPDVSGTFTMAAGITDPYWSRSSLSSLYFDGLINIRCKSQVFFALADLPFYRAYEVIFYDCVNRYQVSVSENIRTTELISSTAHTNVDDGGQWLIDKEDPLVTYLVSKGYSTFTSKNLNDLFLQSNEFGQMLWEWWSYYNNSKDGQDCTSQELHLDSVIHKMSQNLAAELTNDLLDPRSEDASLALGTAWQQEI